MLSNLRRQSPALALAAVALWFALGGTGSASTHGAAAARSTANDNQADTALVKQLAPTLSVHHAATAATALAARISRVVYVHTSFPIPADSQYHTHTAACPAGYDVLGGGGQFAETSQTTRNPNNASTFLGSWPSGRRGWSVVAFIPTSFNTDTLNVYAICAKVAKASG